MLRIKSVDPTVLFAHGDNGLLQVVNVTIENKADAPASGAALTFKLPGLATVTAALGEIAPGKSVHQAKVPDMREPADVKVALKSADGKTTRKTVAFKPRKHWEIHLIPIAHHDYGYTDTIEDVLQFYIDLYNKTITYCEATADWPVEARFHYTCEEAWSLRYYMEHSDEATLDKLAKWVAAGQVEIPALVGNETSGMCGHEELIRLLYPSRTLQRRLGGEICVGSITDVPGLSWALPTVLAGSGVKYFFAGLPPYFSTAKGHATSWDDSQIVRETGVPDAFWWEGPDGSKVLTFYQVGYGGFDPRSTDDVMKDLPGILDEIDSKGNPFSVMRAAAYGCGDNTPTSMVGCEITREWNDTWAFPKLVMSTNTKFFRAVEPECKDLRTFRGEVPHSDYAVGALSSAKETSLNRVTHDKLPAIERFAAIASAFEPGLLTPAAGHFHDTHVMSLDVPQMGMASRIDDAWYDMMMFDEHTWGMWGPVGPIQEFAWHDKSRHAYRAAATATIMGRRALTSIANGIKREAGEHVVVFNPLTMGRDDVVRVNGMETGHLWLISEMQTDSTPFDLIDLETGKSIAYQIVHIDSPQHPAPFAAPRSAMGTLQPPLSKELLFKAQDVPSVGYRAFRMAPRDTAPTFETTLKVTDSSLENEFFKVTVDAEAGVVTSIFDKELQRELVDTEADHHVNQLVVKHAKTTRLKTQAKGKVAIGQTGSVMASLIVTSKALGCPQVTQEIALYDGVKRVDFNNRVLKDSTPLLELHFAFPFKMDRPKFAFEGSNSVIRPFKDQLPGSNTNYYSVQHWAEVSDGEIGITLTPIDSHLVEFGGIHPFRVSPAHRNVEPRDFKKGYVSEEEITDGHMYSFALANNFCTNFRPAQQGDLLFRYSITSHAGDWSAGAPRDFGWARANPLMPVMLARETEGDRPVVDSFCKIDKPNVVLTTLKRAEDEDGFILRLVETEGKATDVTVELPFLAIAEAFTTDLVEKNTHPLVSQPHSVTVTLEPMSIRTIRLRQ